MAEETLKVIIDGEDKLSAASKSAEGGITNLGSTIGSVLTGAAVVGAIVGVGKFLGDAAKAAGEEEVGIIKLSQAVKNSGADWGTASVAIETYLAAELRRTALDDGDGRLAIQRLTETTGDYKVAMDLMAVTQDLAAAKGISVADAATIVGKVHEGNTGVLTRYGIVLEEGASAEEALAALHEKFGGQAEAVGNSYQGAMAKFDIATGNLKETIGAALLPVLTPLINSLVDLAGRVMPWLEGAIAALQPVLQVVMEAMRVALGWIQEFWAEHGQQIIGIITALWDTVKGLFQGAFAIIGDLFRIFSAVFQGDWSGAWDAVKQLFVDKWELIKTLFTGILRIITGLFGTSLEEVTAGIVTFGTQAWGFITGQWSIIQTFFEDLLASISDLFIDTWTGITTWLNTAFTVTLPAIFGTVYEAITEPFQSAWDWLTGLWGTVGDWLRNLFSNIHIPMPHFSINWGEVMGVRIPTGFGVNWYGSGLDAIFRQPTMIGVGEAGAERVQVTPAGGGSKGGGDTWNIQIITPDNQVGALQNLLTMLQMARS